MILRGAFDAKTGKLRHALHTLAESKPEVKDRVKSQPEIVKELATLHEA